MGNTESGHTLSVTDNKRWIIAQPGFILIQVSSIVYMRVEQIDKEIKEEEEEEGSNVKFVLHLRLLNNAYSEGQDGLRIGRRPYASISSVNMTRGELTSFLNQLCGHFQHDTYKSD
jgi:hypothetical protein